jgi:hypothetical protein
MSQTVMTLSVVLSLLLLVPRTGLAVEPEAGLSARTELPRSLHLLEDLAEPAVTRQAPSSATRRLTVLGGALATSAAGGLGGYSLGSVRCRKATSDEAAGSCDGLKYVSLALGSLVGAPIGAWWGGMLTEGRGSFGRALAGAAVGGSVGLVIAMGFGEDFGSAALVSLPVSTALGAMISYEMSHARNIAPEVAAAPGFQPRVAVSSQGAALGLGGSF